MSQPPSHHAADAGFLAAAFAWLTGILPDLYQWLNLLLVLLGIAWYFRQFYLSRQKKEQK